jgi:hypothetical protein
MRAPESGGYFLQFAGAGEASVLASQMVLAVWAEPH